MREKSQSLGLGATTRGGNPSRMTGIPIAWPHCLGLLLLAGLLPLVVPNLGYAQGNVCMDTNPEVGMVPAKAKKIDVYVNSQAIDAIPNANQRDFHAIVHDALGIWNEQSGSIPLMMVEEDGNLNSLPVRKKDCEQLFPEARGGLPVIVVKLVDGCDKNGALGRMNYKCMDVDTGEVYGAVVDVYSGYLDANDECVTKSFSSKFPLRTIAHEIGHYYGVGHPKNGELALMEPTSGAKSTKIALYPYDQECTRIENGYNPAGSGWETVPVSTRSLSIFAREDLGAEQRVGIGVTSSSSGVSAFAQEYLPAWVVRSEDNPVSFWIPQAVFGDLQTDFLDWGYSIHTLVEVAASRQFVSFLDYNDRMDELPRAKVATSETGFKDDVVQMLDVVYCHKLDMWTQDCHEEAKIIPVSTNHRLVMAAWPDQASTIVVFKVVTSEPALMFAKVSEIDYQGGRLLLKTPGMWLESAQSFGFACRERHVDGLSDCVIVLSMFDEFQHHLRVVGVTPSESHSGYLVLGEDFRVDYRGLQTDQTISVWYSTADEKFYMSFTEIGFGGGFRIMESRDSVGDNWVTTAWLPDVEQLAPSVGSSWTHERNTLSYHRNEAP